MARDRANIRTEMWADRDIRSLTLGAQHLYLLLLTHSSLSYAGVADWRPARLAAMTKGWDRDGVEASAEELSRAAFIHTDDETEEVVIRSFLRHDGVIKHPRLHVSMANDWATIASVKIQEFVAFELQKLHSEMPGLALWKDERVKTILRFTGKDLKVRCQEVWQDKAKSFPANSMDSLPKETQGTFMRTATATATATSSKEDKREAPQKRGTRIQEDFQVTSEMAQWATTNAPNVDLNLETTKFKNYWESKAGRDASKLDWIKTWQNWILRSHQPSAAANKPGTADKMRATFALGQQMQAQHDQSTQFELGV